MGLHLVEMSGWAQEVSSNGRQLGVPMMRHSDVYRSRTKRVRAAVLASFVPLSYRGMKLEMHGTADGVTWILLLQHNWASALGAGSCCTLLAPCTPSVETEADLLEKKLPLQVPPPPIFHFLMFRVSTRCERLSVTGFLPLLSGHLEFPPA